MPMAFILMDIRRKILFIFWQYIGESTWNKWLSNKNINYQNWLKWSSENPYRPMTMDRVGKGCQRFIPQKFSSVQSLSQVWLFATAWTVAPQASLSVTNSWSLLKLVSISRWCHPTISSSLIPFFSCPQSFSASGSLPMSQFFTSGGQNIPQKAEPIFYGGEGCVSTVFICLRILSLLVIFLSLLFLLSISTTPSFRGVAPPSPQLYDIPIVRYCGTWIAGHRSKLIMLTHIWVWAYVHTQLLQFCPTLCNPMGCSPPGSSVHGILQARILEGVAMPSSRGCFWLRDWTRASYISCTARGFFTAEPPQRPIFVYILV